MEETGIYIGHVQICYSLKSVRTICIAFTVYWCVFKSNLEMILSMNDDMHRLHANARAFYIRNWSSQRFLVFTGSPEANPCGYRGVIVMTLQ